MQHKTRCSGFGLASDNGTYLFSVPFRVAVRDPQGLELDTPGCLLVAFGGRRLGELRLMIPPSTAPAVHLGYFRAKLRMQVSCSSRSPNPALPADKDRFRSRQWTCCRRSPFRAACQNKAAYLRYLYIYPLTPRQG